MKKRRAKFVIILSNLSSSPLMSIKTKPRRETKMEANEGRRREQSFARAAVFSRKSNRFAEDRAEG